MKRILLITIWLLLAAAAFAQSNTDTVRQSAEEQSLSASELYDKGRKYYDSKDYTNAVQYFRKAAEQGSAAAQRLLGYCYEKGHGVSQDYNEAVRLYRKAAEQGDAAAQNNLGSCYAVGHGVSQDYNEAVRWYRKAAEQGDKTACRNLGNCYKNGWGVQKNKKTAQEWYDKAN